MSIEPNPRRSQQSAAPEHRHRHRRLPIVATCLTISLAVLTSQWVGAIPLEFAQQPEPTPTLDRLAAPVMPESPTPVDIGRKVYYTHCMPCHGDRGQGLTDEWRAVWVEDHQNCWARGCHGGRLDDEGFAIPETVPALSGSPQALARFETADALFNFLRHAHPPQQPGRLSDEDCRALTAYLLSQLGQQATDALQDTGRSFAGDAAIVVGLIAVVLAAMRVWQDRKAATVTGSTCDD